MDVYGSYGLYLAYVLIYVLPLVNYVTTNFGKVSCWLGKSGTPLPTFLKNTVQTYTNRLKLPRSSFLGVESQNCERWGVLDRHSMVIFLVSLSEFHYIHILEVIVKHTNFPVYVDICCILFVAHIT